MKGNGKFLLTFASIGFKGKNSNWNTKLVRVLWLVNPYYCKVVWGGVSGVQLVDVAGAVFTLAAAIDMFASADGTLLTDWLLLVTIDSNLTEFSCASVAASDLRLLHSRVKTVEDSSEFRYIVSLVAVSIVLVTSIGSKGVGA